MCNFLAINLDAIALDETRKICGYNPDTTPPYIYFKLSSEGLK
jgi:hypothetical protein